MEKTLVDHDSVKLKINWKKLTPKNIYFIYWETKAGCLKSIIAQVKVWQGQSREKTEKEKEKKF